MKNYNSSSEQDEINKSASRCIAKLLADLGISLDTDLTAEQQMIVSIVKNNIRKFEYNIKKTINTMNEEYSHDTATKLR
jgi:hypothetical protein